MQVIFLDSPSIIIFGSDNFFYFIVMAIISKNSSKVKYFFGPIILSNSYLSYDLSYSFCNCLTSI